MECYNLVAEEDEDPRNIDIKGLEGHHKLNGHEIEVIDIINPLKMRKLNIGLEAELKYATIGDYLDEDTVNKITDLFHEYQDLFPTKFLDMKGILGDLEVMRIPLKLDAKPVKKKPYRMNPKYKRRWKKTCYTILCYVYALRIIL